MKNGSTMAALGMGAKALVLAMVLLASGGSVLAYDLYGTVYGAGSALPGTLVEALQNGTTTVVGSDTTDNGGAYSMVVDANTYDLRVTPPTESEFTQKTFQDVIITADLQYDVVLASGTGGLSGTLYGHGGATLANQNVLLYTPNWQLIANQPTDVDGGYSFSVGSGTYILYLSTGYPIQPGAPSNYYCYLYDVVVDGATVLDFTLPVVKLSGTVTDLAGSTVSSAVVQTNSQNTAYNPTVNCIANSNSVTADNAGEYSAIVMKGDVDIIAQAPDGWDTGILYLQGESFTQDTSLDLTLPPPTALFGAITGHDGQAVENVNVTLYTADWGNIANQHTDANGQFNFDVGDGSYIIYLGWSSSPNPEHVPAEFYCYHYDVTVVGNTQYDMPLPVSLMSGTVYAPDGSIASGATIKISSQSYLYSPTRQCRTTQETAVSDSNGHYEALAFTQTASITATPPAGIEAAILSVPGLSITGDTVYDINLPEVTLLYGTVTGYGGAPVTGTTVYLYTPSWDILATTQTDNNGNYEFATAAGTFLLYLSNGYPFDDDTPGSYYSYLYEIVVDGDTQKDIPLPLAEVTGQVVDGNGAPIPDVQVKLSSQKQLYVPTYEQYTSNNNTELTDLAGDFAAYLFTGIAHFQYLPPVLSGFASSFLSNVPVNGDFSQIVVLIRPDTTPPVITSGPTVTYLSDTAVAISWTTNEAADSQVDFGIGSLTDTGYSGNLEMEHSIILTGLDASTVYTYQVSSSDEQATAPPKAQLTRSRPLPGQEISRPRRSRKVPTCSQWTRPRQPFTGRQTRLQQPSCTGASPVALATKSTSVGASSPSTTLSSSPA